MALLLELSTGKDGKEPDVFLGCSALSVLTDIFEKSSAADVEVSDFPTISITMFHFELFCLICHPSVIATILRQTLAACQPMSSKVVHTIYSYLYLHLQSWSTLDPGIVQCFLRAAFYHIASSQSDSSQVRLR